MKAILLTSLIVLVTGGASASADDLAPKWTPHEQTAAERLQNFQPPAPLPPPPQRTISPTIVRPCCIEDHVHPTPVGPGIIIRR